MHLHLDLTDLIVRRTRVFASVGRRAQNTLHLSNFGVHFTNQLINFFNRQVAARMDVHDRERLLGLIEENHAFTDG